MANPNPPNPFSEGNQLASKGGGHGALKRISQGQEFIGVALAVQREVEAETGVSPMGLDGLAAIRFQRFCRMEATARLFENMANSSAAEGDVKAYATRKRWMLYASDRASKEQDKLEAALAERTDTVILDALEAADD